MTWPAWVSCNRGPLQGCYPHWGTKHWCAINTVLITNPKYNIIWAAIKNVNCVPARPNTSINMHVYFMILIYGLDSVQNSLLWQTVLNLNTYLLGKMKFPCTIKDGKTLKFGLCFFFVLHSVHKDIQCCISVIPQNNCAIVKTKTVKLDLLLKHNLHSFI